MNKHGTGRKILPHKSDLRRVLETVPWILPQPRSNSRMSRESDKNELEPVPKFDMKNEKAYVIYIYIYLI